jgi:D-alanyl-D-alanine dipeptidase
MRMRSLAVLALLVASCHTSTRPVTLTATAATATAAATPTALVDITTVAPRIRLEMRYAQPDNFLHRAVYPCARCLLRPEAAKDLSRVQASLEKAGYGLKVWDCYRPPAVQREMWKLVPDPRFVADPSKGSVHNRGGAVDITLVDAKGGALEMPTAHDDFTAAAAAEAPASAAATRNRAILRSAMESEGFTALPTEWWHFDAHGSHEWPILDAPLCN